MNHNNYFFSLEALKQPVNQWLCVAFLGLFCFWTLLYYSIQKAEAIADGLIAARVEQMK